MPGKHNYEGRGKKGATMKPKPKPKPKKKGGRKTK